MTSTQSATRHPSQTIAQFLINLQALDQPPSAGRAHLRWQEGDGMAVLYLLSDHVFLPSSVEP